MKILISGGSGFIGKTLTEKLSREGHTMTLLTRAIKKRRYLPEGASWLEGNPLKTGIWQDKAADHEAIVNLAGASIFSRWTKRTRREILESRILTTQNIVKALTKPGVKEKHLINASAVGYYGFHQDEILDEKSPSGSDFLAQVASKWESEAFKAKSTGLRVVLCRFGIVLGKQGGALSKMLPNFKRYLGSPLGNGNQWFSWIHEKDLVSIISFLLKNKNIEGPVNCTAPHPIRNKELTKSLGEALQKPVWIPRIPGFLLKLLFGKSAEILLNGQRVIPKKLMDSGFGYQFPQIREALKDILMEADE